MIKKYKNAKIAVKLRIIGLFIAFFFLVVSLGSVYALYTSATYYATAYDNYGAALGKLCSAEADFQKTRTDLRGVFTESATIEEVEAAVEKDWQELATHMQEYSECIIDDEIRETNQLLYNELEQYYEVATEIVSLMEKGNTQAAERILNSEEAEIENTVYEHFRNIEKISEARGDAERLKGQKLATMYVWILGIEIIVFLLLMIVVINAIIKSISVPIRELVKVAEKISKGDVEVNVQRERKDEVGDLSEMFGAMIDNIKYQANIISEVANANYTVDVVPKSEVDVIGKNLKILVEKNNELFGHTKEAIYQVSAGSNQVALASQSIAQGSTNQASAIEEITVSINSIAEGTRVNAEDASTARTLVVNTKENAIEGNNQMNEMIDAMREINESSENISKIIKVIDDIAFQTNILALNAAVEAARAGAHGKGFAVVAEEVRNLAAKSATAASETAEMIEDSIHKVENGSKLAENTATALKEIEENVESIVDIVTKIAEASNDQATAVAQIDQALGQVSQVVQDNSATSEECASASDELSSQAIKLREMVEGIKTTGTTSTSDSLGFGSSNYKAPDYEPYQDSFESNDYDNSIYGSDEPFIKLDGGYDKY